MAHSAGGCAAALALLIASGCATQPPPLVDSAIIFAGELGGAEPDQLQRGYSFMVIECADCHRAVHPNAHAMSGWDEILPRMLRKATLDEPAGRDIRAYIWAVQNAQPNDSAPRSMY